MRDPRLHVSNSTPLTAAEAVAADLRAVVLLAGGVGRNSLSDAVGRSALDLPVGRGRKLLDVWMERLDRLAAACGLDRLEVRVAIDRDGEAPRLPPGGALGRLVLTTIRDPSEYRGTAGVVRDVSSDLGDGDRVLVASANLIQLEPLEDVVPALAEGGEGVSIVGAGQGEIAGLFLLRRDRLRSVPDVGFVDLKEQALPDSLADRPLRVVRRPRRSALPVRTRDEYVAALRHLAAAGTAETTAVPAAFAETWKPSFALVEEGGIVADGAVLQDAVVLSGGRVEGGAIVARSVVCPGATVRRGEAVVDEVVRD